MERLQPFHVKVSAEALALADFHCNITSTEAVGYISGQWNGDQNSKCWIRGLNNLTAFNVPSCAPILLFSSENGNDSSMPSTHASFHCRWMWQWAESNSTRDSASGSRSRWMVSFPSESSADSLERWHWTTAWLPDHDERSLRSFLHSMCRDHHLWVPIPPQHIFVSKCLITVTCLRLLLLAPLCYSEQSDTHKSNVQFFWAMPPPENRPLEMGRPMHIDYDTYPSTDFDPRKLLLNMVSSLKKCLTPLELIKTVPYSRHRVGSSTFTNGTRSSWT